MRRLDQTVKAVFSILFPDFDRVKPIAKVSKNDGRSSCLSTKISWPTIFYMCEGTIELRENLSCLGNNDSSCINCVNFSKSFQSFSHKERV